MTTDLTRKPRKVKPGTVRAIFCWECGRQLYSFKVHVEMVVDGHSRILHKTCAERIKNNETEGEE